MSNLVLIDTNAWVTYFEPDFRGMPDVADEVERLIVDGKASYTEIIYMELFAGIKNEADVQKFRRAFAGLPICSLVDRSIWVDAHLKTHELWKAGVKLNLVDIIIACVAMSYDISVFHHDSDFVKMAKVLDLKQYTLLKAK
jgi:predicted nucleic acid-binding protein